MVRDTMVVCCSKMAESDRDVGRTLLHGCGTPYARCTIVIQYMCDGDAFRMAGAIRDGKLTDTPPVASTADTDPNYGIHEARTYYEECASRQRNMVRP
jgi:hypothetical protein